MSSVRLEQAQQAVADAAAAMTAPTCNQGGVPLPAVHCNPDLAKQLEQAQERLAIVAEQEANAASGGGKTKYIIGGLAVAALIGGFLFFKSK